MIDYYDDNMERTFVPNMLCVYVCVCVLVLLAPTPSICFPFAFHGVLIQ